MSQVVDNERYFCLNPGNGLCQGPIVTPNRDFMFHRSEGLPGAGCSGHFPNSELKRGVDFSARAGYISAMGLFPVVILLLREV